METPHPPVALVHVIQGDPDPTKISRAYDAAGNRTTATVSGSTRAFTYNTTDGQLDSCSSPTCAITYYDDGGTKLLTDNGVFWFFVYDADGKLVSACKATSCSGSIDRVDYLYDGSGHRTQGVANRRRELPGRGGGDTLARPIP